MAAPDASRSSPGSADSYIGSLISLTSKSEIRYEGVLFTINPEESSIGLRNVRSFGTEGRKKDGPQVPPSDKIYDYIVFRGTDIKDLQVKSSPPAQPAVPMHHDPAIIQSRYPVFPAAPPTSLPPTGVGSLPDTVSQNPQQQGPSGPALQGSLPLAQPGGPLGPWGAAPPSATNAAGLTMPLYWQRFYGASGGLQPPQQSLLQPTPPGLPMPSLMSQTYQLPTAAQNFPASQLSENPTPLVPVSNGGSLQSSNAPSNLQSSQYLEMPTSLVPPFGGVSLNPQPAGASTESSIVASNAFMNSMIDKGSTQLPPATASLTTSFPFVSPLTSVFDKTAISPPATDNPKALPSLVTPGQLLQPVASAVPLSQSSETVQKDVQVVQVSSSETRPLPTAPSSTPETVPNLAPSLQQPAPEMQEPILPLPSGPNYKVNGSPASRQYGYGGGRGRGRGYGRQQATRVTEDFDFTAMNEKFKKDEVWGYLGKGHTADEDGEGVQDEEGTATKPVYVKDDFFDTLSCDALDGGLRNGRTRFSEQLRKDAETFGDLSRHRGGRGGRGHYRGGRTRGGSYYGRGGFGYPSRGRGGYGPPR